MRTAQLYHKKIRFFSSGEVPVFSFATLCEGEQTIASYKQLFVRQ